MLLRSASWTEAWVSLTRAHKDKRARKHLGRFLLMLLAPVLCLGYLIWVVGSLGLLAVPVIALIIWWQGRRAKDQTPLPSVVPGAEPVDRVLTDEERDALRGYFGELTLMCGVMVARSGSESFQKEKVLPEGMEVIARRKHLDLLKEKGIWERMRRADREAMMMPDGHWEWATINQVAMAMEALRLLRWMLRIDYYLPLVGQQLKGDYATAYEVVATPQKVLEAAEMAELKTIRVGRDAAGEYYQRCVAEAIHRGYYEAAHDEAAEWAKRVAESLKGKQNQDFLLGGKLVSEATRDELLWAMSLARRRRDFLNWVMTVMQAGKAPEGEFPGVMAEVEVAS